MSNFFINPLMLLGLLGVALPVIAHLLSRKKYDVVEWGAMQFLELGRQAKRRVRLEEFLLLALRIGLIALLAIGMSRPWLSGPIAAFFASAPASDYVIVIDSSYSANWRGAARTPHQRAVKWAQDFIGQLSSADTVALLDARDVLNPVMPTFSRDRVTLKKLLDELPPPTGTSRMNEAVVKALQMMQTGTSLSRHVIVISDGQAVSWQNADEHFWLQFDELRQQATVPADVWVVNTQAQQGKRTNFSLDRLQLSRELTVIDFPVRIKTRLKCSGGYGAATRKVFLEVDGQRLADQTQTVRIEPDGQASLDFEHRFKTVGSHLVAVVTEEDNLPNDDRSEATVSITDALPVLIVDGQPQADATRSETFFAKLALSAASNPTPWIGAQVVPVSQLTAERLAAPQVVVLANVSRLDDAQVSALTDYVESGGGLAITMGDLIDRDWYNATLLQKAGLLPAKLLKIEAASRDKDAPPVTVLNESLQLPWLKPFKDGASDGFLDARFTNWMKTEAADENCVVAAKLTSGDAWLVSRSVGRGQVALLTSTLDADWTTFPAKPDYVAFLHELIFDLTSGRIARNVDAGVPLVVPLGTKDAAADFVFVAPNNKELAATAGGAELRPLAKLDETTLPGVYRLHRRNRPPQEATKDELFVVNFDRTESELAPISEERWRDLTAENHLRAINEPRELLSSLKSDNARVELWHILMLAFLAILVGEVVMTRKLVQGGHAFVEDEPA